MFVHDEHEADLYADEFRVYRKSWDDLLAIVSRDPDLNRRLGASWVMYDEVFSDASDELTYEAAELRVKQLKNLLANLRKHQTNLDRRCNATAVTGGNLHRHYSERASALDNIVIGVKEMLEEMQAQSDKAYDRENAEQIAYEARDYDRQLQYEWASERGVR